MTDDKFLKEIGKGSGLYGATDDIANETERLSKKKMDLDSLF